MQILIVKEKHGTSYYEAASPRQLDVVCKHILKERLEQGYYDTYKPDPSDIELISEDVPECLIPEAKKRNARALRLKNTYEQDVLQRQEIVEAIDAPIKLSKRGIPWSYGLLANRSHAEYEEVELCEVISLPVADDAPENTQYV